MSRGHAATAGADRRAARRVGRHGPVEGRRARRGHQARVAVRARTGGPPGPHGGARELPRGVRRDGEGVSLQPTALTSVNAAGAREWTELLGRRYPQAFSDAVDEHHTVRRAAGVFDFSFMTHARVRGPGASAFVQRLITNDATRLVPGRIVYSPICNEAGGMVDDC